MASSAPERSFDGFTYTAFPPEKYQAFLDRYVLPFGSGFERVLDLGCGSGGLIERLQKVCRGEIVGVDVSKAAIEACRARSSVSRERVRFVQADLRDLAGMEELRESFDLVVSYSVLHFVPGDTAEKVRLLRGLTRPGALVAVDALARIPWNRAMFGLVRGLIRTGLWAPALRLLSPVVGPSFPRAFMEELSRMTYLEGLRYADFLDLRCLESGELDRSFELLRFDRVRQDGFFTGEKARFTLRRR